MTFINAGAHLMKFHCQDGTTTGLRVLLAGLIVFELADVK